MTNDIFSNLVVDLKTMKLQAPKEFLSSVESVVETSQQVGFNQTFKTIQIFFLENEKEAWGIPQTLNENTTYRDKSVLDCGHRSKPLDTSDVIEIILGTQISKLIEEHYGKNYLGGPADCDIALVKGELAIVDECTPGIEVIAQFRTNRLHLEKEILF